MTLMPNDLEISQAVEALFSATGPLDRIARWNALVPTDADLSAQFSQGQKQVTYVPTYEFSELIDFVHCFGSLLESHGQTEPNQIRVMLMVYCHVMESEFMLTLIWNQLRLLNGQQPSWRFTHITPRGKTVVCEYPREKFSEINTLAQRVGQPIGDVISCIWDRHLRNAFSHSRYWLGSAHVLLSVGLSPISRNGPFASGKSRSYSFNEVRDRYRSARSMLFAVASEHSKACKAYNVLALGGIRCQS